MSTSPVDPIGFRLPRWLQKTGVARSSWYKLPPHLRPETATINGLIYVLEAAAAWFLRVRLLEAQQGVGKRRGRPRNVAKEVACAPGD